MAEQQRLLSKDHPNIDLEEGNGHSEGKDEGEDGGWIKEITGFTVGALSCPFAAFGAVCVRELNEAIPDIEVCTVYSYPLTL